MSTPKTYLLLFDFDGTLTDSESFIKLFPLVKDEAVKKSLYECLMTKQWYKGSEIAFSYLKSIGFGLKEYKKSMLEDDLSKGMPELLEYLKQNKQKFVPYVLTSNLAFLIEDYLKTKNVLDSFCAVIGEKGHGDEKENEIKIEPTEREKECDICCRNICKTDEYEKLMTKCGEEVKKVVFVCDGENDYCLARNLKEGDVAFVRKDFGLDKKMKKDGIKLKCEVVYWETGTDIKNVLEKYE